MAISSEHIPISRSLRDRALNHFAQESPPPGADTLSRRDLVGYLAKSKDTDSSPLATIRRRASKDNRSATLKAEHQAILAWVCDAFSDWQEHYPIEAPLRDQVHRLLPLTIAIALSDEDFAAPGRHPIHHLLDAIQKGAVGWQLRLERAGQMLEQRVQRAVDKAMEWFRDDRLDIGAITRELEAANERDAARAQRMVQRLAETEAARIKTLAAKRDAAELLNRGFKEFRLPAAIGEFLTGPWYDSAQLVLVKFGLQSREWEQMQRATRHLMESVQGAEDDPDAHRDRQQQLLRHLPGELRRWLLSLEHDTEATDSAVGLVEYAHLRLQHGQKLELINVSPLPVDGEDDDEEGDADPMTEGQWYCINEADGPLRAQLVLQLEKGKHLLFTNYVGLKALDLSRNAFRQRLSDGFAYPLANRHSFSISLAAAAGIDSDDALRQFLDPDHRPPLEEPRTSPDRMPPPTTRVDDPVSRAPDPVETAPISKAGSAGETESWDDPTSGFLSDFDADSLEPAVETSVEEELVLSLDLDEDFALEAGADSATDAGDPSLDPAPPGRASAAPAPSISSPVHATAEPGIATMTPTAPERIGAAQTGGVADAVSAPPPLSPVAAAPEPVRDSVPPSPVAAAATGSDPGVAAPAARSSEAAAIAKASGATSSGPAVLEIEHTGVSDASSVAGNEPKTVSNEPRAESSAPAQVAPSVVAEPPPIPGPSAAPKQATAPQEASSPASTEAAPEAAEDTREVEVPMGAWLGFHDGETPIMAKLAVFDPRRDNYIFVNRKGIALRELSRAELLKLMDEGLVDILETRCYFRDEVAKARGEES